MLVLGIETSCDETSVAVVDDGVTVRSNVIASSRKTFERLAGVIPEQAARHQVECMMPVWNDALAQAGVQMSDIDAIAVTRGPGLLGSLLVGTVAARAVSSVQKIPLIGVHHTLGHLSSTWLDGGLVLAGNAGDPVFPVLTLSASGGHTDLWLRTSHTTGTLLGRTRDDAAGEAFDKGASMLGLPYPGGPSIERSAKDGNAGMYKFPLPLAKESTNDFSFSGLKTALKYLLRDTPGTQTEDVAASYQDGICAHLLDRVKNILQSNHDIREVHIVGGVSANSRLRQLATELCASLPHAPVLRVPKTLAFCTDNAAMIAAAGTFLHRERPEFAQQTFTTEASLPLETTVFSA
jgi:N6-L-threonylcarbamoyladenine synthase